VDLWWFDLDEVANGRGSQLGGWLSMEERQRAARAATPDLRRRSKASREALRAILGAYREIQPAAVTLSVGAEGKPFLGDGLDAPLAFSIAHTEALGCIAVAGRDIGVDIERVRDGVDIARIAAHMFSAAEAAELTDLPYQEKRDRFFQRWVRVEASAKARGVGVYPAASPRPRTTTPDDNGTMSFCSFTLGQDVLGCVAATGDEPISLSPLRRITDLLDAPRLL
jgi:4'-phosphopantetheinyl transferase